MPRLLCPSWRWMTISGTPSRQLDGVGVAQLVWSEAAPYSGHGSGAAEVGSCRGGRPVATARCAADDAQERTDRELAPHLKPGLQLFPAPGIHADLAAAPALSVPDQQRATALVQVAFGESERL